MLSKNSFAANRPHPNVRVGATNRVVSAHSAYPVARIDNARFRRLLRIVDGLRARYPEIPERVAADEYGLAPSISEGRWGQDRLAVYFSFLEPGVSARLHPHLEAEIAAAKLGLVVTRGGESVSVNDRLAYKGRALEHFADRLGIPVSEIRKFGDSAHPGGNDVTLVADAGGVSVGPRPSASASAWASRRKYAAGTADVLSGLDSRLIRGIAVDYDGTLTRRDSEEMLPEACRQLVRHLNAGVPIAVITGRGPSVLERVVPPLLRSGAEPWRVASMPFWLFNGAVLVLGSEHQAALGSRF